MFPASYPLPTLVEVPSEWALDLLAGLYQAEIHGTHGFGLTHPRADWLRLVVSSVEECNCGAPGRWEDATLMRRADGSRVLWCARCADGEIAIHAAEKLRRASRVPRAFPAYETERTVVVPFLRDADLPRPAASVRQ